MRTLLVIAALVAIVLTARATPSPLCRSFDRSMRPIQNHRGFVLARGGGMGGGMGGMTRPQVTGMGGAPSGGGMNAGTGGGMNATGGGMTPPGGGIPPGGATAPSDTDCPKGGLRPKSLHVTPNLFSWLSPCGAKF